MKSQRELIELIYSAIHQPELWVPILDEVCKTIDSSHAFIAVRSSTDDSPVGFYETGFGHRHFETYQEHFYKVDLWTQNLARHSAASGKFNQFHASHWVCDDTVYLKSEIHNDFCKPVNIRHSIGCLGLPGNTNSQLVTEIAFLRSEGQQHYDEKVVRQANQLVPHIKQSLEISQAVHSMMSNNINFQALFDLNPNPCAVLDTNLKFVYINKSFDFLISQNSGITYDGSGLGFRETQADQEFKRAFGLARSSLNGISSFPPTFSVKLRTTEYDVTLKPCPIQKISPWGNTQETAISVEFIAAKSLRNIESNTLSDYFNLTLSEGEVFSAICRGLYVDEIASLRSSSPSTIRQQIKSCLQKTESRSQTELVSKILRLLL